MGAALAAENSGDPFVPHIADYYGR